MLALEGASDNLFALMTRPATEKKRVLTEHLMLLVHQELILPVQPISGMLKSAASTISAYHQMLTTDNGTAGDLNGGAPAPKAATAAAERRRIFVGGGGVAKKTGGGGAAAGRRE